MVRIAGAHPDPRRIAHAYALNAKYEITWANIGVHMVYARRGLKGGLCALINHITCRVLCVMANVNYEKTSKNTVVLNDAVLACLFYLFECVCVCARASRPTCHTGECRQVASGQYMCVERNTTPRLAIVFFFCRCCVCCFFFGRHSPLHFSCARMTA